MGYVFVFDMQRQAGYCSSLQPTELDGRPITGQWTAGDKTWQKTYDDHTSSVASAHPAFDWRVEAEEEDWVHPGT